MPMPSQNSQPTLTPSMLNMPRLPANSSHHSGGVLRSSGSATASVIEWKSWPPRISGARPLTGS